MSADGYGNPGLTDGDSVVVTCHIEVWTLKTVPETSCDSNKDIADHYDNHDGLESEFDAPLVCPFNSSANGVLGTVAGTVINTLLYNSMEATLVPYTSTNNLDVMIVEPTEVAFGFDPFIGGTATGKLGTRKVHEIGKGLTTACGCAEAETSKNGKECTATLEPFHTANKVKPAEWTVESVCDKWTEGTIDPVDELDCDGTCAATDACKDASVSATSNNSHKSMLS